ncbi:iron-containing alcohol dehydrogenase family protein [Breznakiellaceae bacterium SP9]
MKFPYYMPTKIIAGTDCLWENRALLRELGTKAMIITGGASSKANGSLDDAKKALSENGQAFAVFDAVMSNPTVDCVFEAAAQIKRNNCDFIVSIGGGSPLDAAKVAAALAVTPCEKDAIFTAVFTKALPIAAVPTTAGTGSEVTPNGVLTNDTAKTKTSVASPALFARYAFLDAKYTDTLSARITINTAIDALSHAIEGMLSVKASAISDALALQSIALSAQCFQALKASSLGTREREKLLLASTLGGMVIANTGTTAVHALGYSLTYFKHIDHGRANALLLGAYLRFVAAKETGRIASILNALDMHSLNELCTLLDALLGAREQCNQAELEAWADTAINAKNITNCAVRPERSDLLAILQQSLLELST